MFSYTIELTKLLNVQMAIDDLSNLTTTEKEYNMRFGVWRSLHDWIRLTESWRTGYVRRLNGPEIISKTDEYSKEAYKMGKASKEDTVVFRLKDTIDDFKKVSIAVSEEEMFSLSSLQE